MTGADVRAATAFLVHQNALCALAEADSGPADTLDAPSPLVAASLSARRGPELAQPEATGLRLFFCVPDVAARCDPALAAPPGIAAEPRLARRTARRCGRRWARSGWRSSRGGCWCACSGLRREARAHDATPRRRLALGARWARRVTSAIHAKKGTS
jgi:hypothetical protein